MEISKTKISKRMDRKTNPVLVETINLAKKNNFLDLAKKLSTSTKLQSRVSLDKISKLKEDTVIVVGKVLGQGEIEKKIEIAALGFSEQAKDKLSKAGCKMSTIKKYILDKKKLEGVKIL
jgi:large subunit ribosomal protein L18e